MRPLSPEKTKLIELQTECYELKKSNSRQETWLCVCAVISIALLMCLVYGSFEYHDMRTKYHNYQRNYEYAERNYQVSLEAWVSKANELSDRLDVYLAKDMVGKTYKVEEAPTSWYYDGNTKVECWNSRNGTACTYGAKMFREHKVTAATGDGLFLRLDSNEWVKSKDFMNRAIERNTP